MERENNHAKEQKQSSWPGRKIKGYKTDAARFPVISDLKTPDGHKFPQKDGRVRKNVAAQAGLDNVPDFDPGSFSKIRKRFAKMDRVNSLSDEEIADMVKNARQ